MSTPKNPFHPAEQNTLFALAMDGMVSISDLDKWDNDKRITKGQYSDFWTARVKVLNKLGVSILHD